VTATTAGDEAPRPDVVTRHRGLVGRTVLVAVLTFASRIGGFVREILSAALFGDVSPMFDAFVTAWRLPNLFRRFLGEGALSTALQTSLTAVDDDQGEAAGRRLFLGTLRTLTWILIGLCAVTIGVVWLVPDVMPFTGLMWLGESAGVVRELMMRMMPFVILVCISAVCTGALNVRGHFLLPALAPVVMNVAWIAALFVIAWEFGWAHAGDPRTEELRQLGMVRWLASSVLLGGVLLLVVQVPALWTKGLLPWGAGHEPRPDGPRTEPDARPVWTVLKRTVPLAFGAAIYQINVMVDGFMAVALLEPGGPTAHYMATRLQQLPMALTSIAAASAVFPALTALGHRRALGELRALHDRTQLAVAFVALPAMIGLVVLAGPIVEVCFGHGAFGASGVQRTAAALRFLALAIVPAGAVGLIARCYYALGDFSTPVRVSAVMLVANVGLNTFLLVGLGMDVEGLALSTALTSWGNLFLLLRLTGRLELPPGEGGLRQRIARMMAAAAACGATAWGVERLAVGPFGLPLGPALGLAIVASIVTFCGFVHLLRLPEWNHVLVRLRGRGATREDDATDGPS